MSVNYDVDNILKEKPKGISKESMLCSFRSEVSDIHDQYLMSDIWDI